MPRCHTRIPSSDTPVVSAKSATGRVACAGLVDEALSLRYPGLRGCLLLCGRVSVLLVVSIDGGQGVEPLEFPGHLLGQRALDHTGDRGVLQRRRPAHLGGERLADGDVEDRLLL